MKRKVEIIGEDFGYWTIEDCTEYYNDVLNSEGKEAADNYFKCGEFDGDLVEEQNGRHFLFGHLECLYQSDDCPSRFFSYKGELRYVVSEIKE